MKVRQYLLLIHRYGGLAIALFLVIAALTGSIIAFEKELDAWLNPHLFKVEVKQERCTPYQLRELVASRYPYASVHSIDLHQSADASLAFYLRPLEPDQPALAFNKIFIDPYTGIELGRRNTAQPEFTRENLIPLIYRLHYSLLIPGKWGIWLFGGVALFWTVDCFIGFYLTLPARRFSLASWKHAWKIKLRARFIRINFDLHRALGLWLWCLFLIMAISSVRLNLFNEVFRPLVSMLSTVSNPDVNSTKASPRSGKAIIGYAEAVRSAEQYLVENNISAEVQNIYYISSREQYEVSFKAKDTWRDIIGYSYVALDAGTGQATRIVWESGETAGDTFIAWMFPLHSGKAFGLTGRIIVSMLGVLVVVLVSTGIIIWWKKKTIREPRLRKVMDAVKNLKSKASLSHPK